MKFVTARNLRILVPGKSKVMRTNADVLVNFTTKAETENVGRLAVDNELVRMKYCI